MHAFSQRESCQNGGNTIIATANPRFNQAQSSSSADGLAMSPPWCDRRPAKAPICAAGHILSCRDKTKLASRVVSEKDNRSGNA
jgi:hypothetical protein